MSSGFCTRCGKPLSPGAAACASCGTPTGGGSAPPTAGGPGTSPAARGCSNCRAQMRWVGHYSLRATGHPGAAGSAAVDLAQSPETLLPFSLYYCQSCGRFDFYYPGT